MTPVDVVERQLAAYNNRDLAGFLAAYSEGIMAWRLPDTTPALTGKMQFAAFYAAERFNRPALHATVLSRIVLGNKVIDHERISGVRNAPFEIILAYEVMNGLIERTWALAPE